MDLQTLPIVKLLVNRANDRHGELENETAAIAWLFSNRDNHMRNLAKDIVAKAGIYEPPLVSQVGEDFIVFDGNRRVTCLKLITHPERAPSTELQSFFRELQKEWVGRLPEAILCQVEADKDRLDEILYRRHTGTQDGVGQSKWDDRMKANFVARTGQASGVHVSDEIEKKLIEAKLWDESRKIPRSNMNRLLSSEAYRNRVGFSLVNGKFQFTHDEEVVLKALARIGSDLVEKKLVLGDIWDGDGKRAYLNELDKSEVLPTARHLKAQIAGKASSATAVNSSKKTNSVSHRLPDVRETLIAAHFSESINWTAENGRIKNIWDELQFRLKLSIHANSIAVMFRVLVEISIDQYIERNSLASIHPNDNLSNRARKVSENLLDRGKISQKYFNECRKWQNSDKLFSIATMNSWVHSPSFNPSTQHMTAMWDSLSKFVVCCIND